MKSRCNFLNLKWAILLLLCFPIYVYGATVKDKNFDLCIKRVRAELTSCGSGCGLILKGCYDEAIGKYQKNIDEVVSSTANNDCREKLRAMSVKFDAFRADLETSEESGSWQQFDIRLLSTKAELDFLKAFRNSCSRH